MPNEPLYQFYETLPLPAPLPPACAPPSPLHVRTGPPGQYSTVQYSTVQNSTEDRATRSVGWPQWAAAILVVCDGDGAIMTHHISQQQPRARPHNLQITRILGP